LALPHKRNGLLLIALAGLASAVLFMTGFSGHVEATLLLLLCPLPLLLVGMTFGSKASLQSAITASIGVAAASVLLAGATDQSAPAPPILTYLIIYWVANALPSLLLLDFGQRCRLSPDKLSIRWPSVSAVVELLTLYGALLLLAGLGFLQLTMPDWVTQLGNAVRHALTLLPPNKNGPLLLTYLDSIVKILPGTLVLLWMGNLLLNIYLAQMIAIRNQVILRPPLFLIHLYFPKALALGFLAMLALSMQLPPSGLSILFDNLLYVIALPLILVGIGVLQAMVLRQTGKAWLSGWLSSWLFFMMFIIGWPVLLLLLLGMLDPWLQTRQKSAKKA
jgi:hypothetical protein